jgi:DNA polymerase III delta prime subunit
MLVGHEKTIALLSKIAASYNIPHVILFTGRGVGMDEKKMVAYEFARWLFHTESEASQNFSQFYEANAVVVRAGKFLGTFTRTCLCLSIFRCKYKKCGN